MAKRGIVVDLNYARTSKYREILKTIAREGRCPFCPDNFRFHKHPILYRKNGWFVTLISFPYKNSQYHFLIIGEKHREDISQLTQRDFMSIGYLARWVQRRFHLRGGAIAMRFGPTRFTGATVCHLHAHLIVPYIDARTRRAKTVTFPIG